MLASLAPTGMEYFTSPQLAALLETSLATAKIVPAAGAPKGVAFENAAAEGGCAAGHAIDWLTIANQEDSIKADVEKVVTSPLTAAGIPVHGYLYDVKTGSINHVVSALTK